MRDKQEVEIVDFLIQSKDCMVSPAWPAPVLPGLINYTLAHAGHVCSCKLLLAFLANFIFLAKALAVAHCTS